MRRAAILFAVATIACGPRTETPATDTSASAGTTSPATAAADVRAAVDTLRSAWSTGAEKRDLAAVAALYSDDAILQIAGAPLARGRDGIQKSLAQAFGIVSNLKVNSEGTDVSGDLAVDRGTYSEHVAPPGGKAMDVSGRYIVVLKHGANGWKITNHMGWLPPAK